MSSLPDQSIVLSVQKGNEKSGDIPRDSSKNGDGIEAAVREGPKASSLEGPAAGYTALTESLGPTTRGPQRASS